MDDDRSARGRVGGRDPSIRAASGARAARAAEPFIDGYLAYLLARASHLISGEFHRMLRARRVPVMQWRVLASLYDGPLTAKALADVVLTKQPTLSRLVERMERQGLVQRSANVEDRRSIVLSLTERGRALAEPLIASAREHEAAVLRPFGKARGDALLRTLQRLIDLHSD